MPLVLSPRAAMCVIGVILVTFSGCLVDSEDAGEQDGATGPADASKGSGLSSCPADARDYEAPDGVFTLCIPPGWVYEEGVFGGVVAFYREADITGDAFIPSANVYAEPASPGENLDGLREELMHMLPQVMTDWELEHEGRAQLGDLDALELRYHARQGAYILSFHQYLVIHDGTGYAWTHTTEKGSGQWADPEVRSMRESMEFH